MKILIVLLATFAFTSAAVIEARDVSNRSASSSIVDFIEGLRDQMACGFPKYNIPPLAPLKIEHKQVAIEGETLSVEGEVNQARVYGLNEFEITDMRVNMVLSRVNCGFLWENISIKSLYDLEALLKSYGVTVNLRGAGDLSLSIKDLYIQGTIKYSLGLISNQIKLKEVKIVVTVGDVDSEIEGLLGEGFVNRKLNEIIEEIVLLSVNDNQDFITNTIEAAVLPTVNNAVDGMSLGDVIAAAVGGGGDEKPVCVPLGDN